MRMYQQRFLFFYRWIIQGTKHELSAGKKSEEVFNPAVALSRTTASMFLTERQVKNKKSDVVRSSLEMPWQLAVGIAEHQAVRNKQLITMLHGFGISVDYNRILRVEAQIEASVLKRMELNDGLYIPPDLVLGRHVLFAVDNVDFAEDTPGGKNTFHGTAKAGTRRCFTRADSGSRRSVSLLNQTASRVCDNLARMSCAPQKACWSHLPPVWIVYRKPTSIVHQEARFHMASRTQFDQNDHQWRS